MEMSSQTNAILARVLGRKQYRITVSALNAELIVPLQLLGQEEYDFSCISNPLLLIYLVEDCRD